MLDNVDENFTIFINGDWGTGKTFLVKQIYILLTYYNEYINYELEKYNSQLEQIIQKDYFKELKLEKNFVQIYYNAWNNDSHIDPINSIIFNIIKEQVELSKIHKDNLLFVANNGYVRHNSVNSVLKRIFRMQLGLDDEGISTHVLRHTFATRCIELGMNAVVLQKLMGHKDIGVTLNTYTSVFNEFKENEIKKVSKGLNKKLAEMSEEYEL